MTLLVGISARSFALPSLNEIVSALEQVDRKMAGVKTAGHMLVSSWNESNSSWAATPQSAQFSCAIENKYRARYVLNLTPALNIWIAGKAPYLGTWSTEFREADGVVTHWDWAYQYHDGTNYSAPRFEHSDAYRRTDSELTREPADLGFSGLGYTGLRAIRNTPIFQPSRADGFSVTNTEGGMIRVSYSFPEAFVLYDFILDPQKNYTLLRYKYAQMNAQTPTLRDFTVEHEVIENQQVANGVWYPVHFTDTTRYSKEYADRMRAQLPPGEDHGLLDIYVDHKSEIVFTKVELLDGTNIEANLVFSLPTNVVVRK